MNTSMQSVPFAAEPFTLKYPHVSQGMWKLLCYPWQTSERSHTERIFAHPPFLPRPPPSSFRNTPQLSPRSLLLLSAVKQRAPPETTATLIRGVLEGGRSGISGLWERLPERKCNDVVATGRLVTGSFRRSFAHLAARARTPSGSSESKPSSPPHLPLPVQFIPIPHGSEGEVEGLSDLGCIPPLPGRLAPCPEEDAEQVNTTPPASDHFCWAQASSEQALHAEGRWFNIKRLRFTLCPGCIVNSRHFMVCSFTGEYSCGDTKFFCGVSEDDHGEDETRSLSHKWLSCSYNTTNLSLYLQGFSGAAAQWSTIRDSFQWHKNPYVWIPEESRANWQIVDLVSLPSV